MFFTLAGTHESSVVPGDGTISTAKIQNDAITGAKIEKQSNNCATLTSTGLITASRILQLVELVHLIPTDDYNRTSLDSIVAHNGIILEYVLSCKYRVGSSVKVISLSVIYNMY